MLRFRYKQIERAIARAHGLPIDDVEVMKTFRGRVRNFQKLGLVPSAPGKGQKVSYAYSDAAAWVLCFELAEMGLPPLAIKQVVNQMSEATGKYLTTAIEGQEHRDVYLVMEGSFLQWHFDAAPVQFRAKLEFLDRLLLDGLPDRASLVNLANLKKRLSAAFAAEVTSEDLSEPGVIEPFSAF